MSVAAGERAPSRHRSPSSQREFVLACAILGLVALMAALTQGRFAQPGNLTDILLNSAIPLVAAAGMTALIISAQIDISIGASMAVCAVTVAALGVREWPIPLLLLVSVAVGSALGAVNGLLTAGLRIPSSVATLATLGATKGLLVLFTRGVTIPVPERISALGSSRYLGLHLLVWIAAAICVAFGVYLSRTPLGRRHYAIGSNPRSAELSGIPTAWMTFYSFVLLGAMVGVAGWLYVLRFTPIDSHPQPGLELMVITAVVVGGTDIFGGRGTLLGTALAAILLKTIDSALTFVGSITPALRSEVQPAIQGLLVLAAVLYSSLTRRD